MATEIPVHPVQNNGHRRGVKSVCPQAVTLKAYEVYRMVCGEQKSLIEGECRGGFGVSELIAFLYAGNFPASEWRQRFDEAITGMEGI